jgi:hypothetical protein
MRMLGLAIKDARGFCQKNAPGLCAVAYVNDKPAAT